MQATIEQINKTPSGYAVIASVEGKNPKQFEFKEDVTAEKIEETIQAWLLVLKVTEGKLPELRKALVGKKVKSIGDK